MAAYSCDTGAELWHSGFTDVFLTGTTLFEFFGTVYDGVMVMYQRNTRQWYGYDEMTGQKIWGPARANGSGWLTSHRLILCEHPSGQLEGHTPEEYWLKSFGEARIKESTLTVSFQNKKAKIQLPLYAPAYSKISKPTSAKNWNPNNNRFFTV
jgi:hypothetical protein